MKRGTIRRLERMMGRGAQPFAHVSDKELLAAIERLRAGKPSGITILPDGATTGYEHLSDQELLRRLEALRTQLCGPRRFGRQEEEQ